MAELGRGTRVEICPYPKGKNRAYHHFAELDGCQAIVEVLTGHGEEMKARVIVSSKCKDRAGTRFIPAKALKPVEAKEAKDG